MYMCQYCFLLQSIYFCKCMYCIKLMLINVHGSRINVESCCTTLSCGPAVFFPIQTLTILVFCANHLVNIGFQAIILISFHMTLSVNCKWPTPSSYITCSTSSLLPKHTLSTTFKVWHSYCCYLFDRLI